MQRRQRHPVVSRSTAFVVSPIIIHWSTYVEEATITQRGGRRVGEINHFISSGQINTLWGISHQGNLGAGRRIQDSRGWVKVMGGWSGGEAKEFLKAASLSSFQRFRS